jgi:UDP-GlcNAc3NAcA epimerase
MKICSVIGARPQFVKAGAVSRALLSHGIDEVLIHTGQHYDTNMSEVFFREFAISAPKYNLGVGSGTHGGQTARMLDGIEQVLLSERPDVVLVYGDTNSTLAAAIAAVKLRIPVAHVEAGLRSFNRAMPEEINRIVADSVSEVLFVPTINAAAQLRREGQPEDRIVWTGDVMYDAALMMSDIARANSTIVQDLGLVEKEYFLATVHRAENTDDEARLRAIFGALMTVAERYPVVVPLHPRTRAALDHAGLLSTVCQRLRVLEPVGFFDMVRLEMGAHAIASDSGGVQKEAFFHRVPCFILRNETEWVELVAAGWNTLVPPTDAATIAATMLATRSSSRAEVSPYGRGDASQIIARELLRRFSSNGEARGSSPVHMLISQQ